MSFIWLTGCFIGSFQALEVSYTCWGECVRDVETGMSLPVEHLSGFQGEVGQWELLHVSSELISGVWGDVRQLCSNAAMTAWCKTKLCSCFGVCTVNVKHSNLTVSDMCVAVLSVFLFFFSQCCIHTMLCYPFMFNLVLFQSLVFKVKINSIHSPPLYIKL